MDESELPQGQVASGRGLGGTDLEEARCARRRAAKGSDGGAAGHQGCLARSSEKGECVAWLCGVGKTRCATCRLGRGTCKTRALLALRACTGRARRSARACYRAWVRLAINRSRLGETGSLVDMLV